MQLQAQTLKRVKQLEQLAWFSNVGKPINFDQPKVLSVASWEEASIQCQSRTWQSIIGSNSNIMYGFIADFSDEKIELYEGLDSTIRATVGELADLAIKYIELAQEMITPIRTRITWDIGHYLIWSEFEKEFDSCFSEQLGNLYLGGRFPCGWRGVFPFGCLIVF